LLIKRYTLEIDNLVGSLDGYANDPVENKNFALDSDDEWNYRDSILKCLYSKDVQYPFSDHKFLILCVDRYFLFINCVIFRFQMANTAQDKHVENEGNELGGGVVQSNNN
jgi:hypothetical protein